MIEMILRLNARWVLSLLGLFVLFSSQTVSADVNLIFGVYTSDKPSTMVKKFRPLLNVLQKQLAIELNQPVKLKMRVAKSYDDGIQDLVNGRVDMARLGPASYVEAKKKNPDISILAIESKRGKKRFKGVICIRADSNIGAIADLKGKRFAFGNQRSTIGRYLAQQYLTEHGIRAADLASFDYLGRHDKVGEAVAQGQYDAGALKSGTFKSLVKKGRTLVKLATFFNVTKPWVARSQLPSDVKAAIVKVLLALKDPVALKALKKDGFLTGNDDDYAIIRRSIDNNKLFFQ